MKVIADTEIRVATLSGAVVVLQPGVEREVADEIGLEALKLGAKQVSESKKVEAAPSLPEEVPSSDLQVAGEVLKGIEDLVELSDPMDFKADGTPKATAVNRVVGRVVRTDEREAAWEAFLNS